MTRLLSAVPPFGLLPLLLLLLSAPAARALHWQHAQQLGADFRLLWSISDDGLDITFEMQARTHGYVGLGLTRPKDRTGGADLIVGWVDNGQTYLQVSVRTKGDRLTWATQTWAACFESTVGVGVGVVAVATARHYIDHTRRQSFNYKYNLTTDANKHALPALTS